MMMNEGILLRHLIFADWIIEPAKIEVILKIQIPKTQKEVHIFLGNEGYYRIFIEKIQRLHLLYFIYL